MNRLDVINRQLGGDGCYLEIGVRGGEVFWQVRARTRIAVDPAFVGRKLNRLTRLTPLKTATGLWTRTLLFSEPSDKFFERRQLLDRIRLDCVLVDGLHTAEQAYRDVEHSLKWLAPDGMIVMHDCNPQSETAALPSMDDAKTRPDYTGVWNGDVWRAVLRLRTRTDLNVRVLDCDHGLGIVTRGEPDSLLTDAEASTPSYAEFSADRARLLNLTAPA